MSELTITHTERVTYASWDNTYTQILTTSDDGTIRMSDAQTGDVIWQIDYFQPILGASWSHDNRTILAWDEQMLLIIDADSGEFGFEGSLVNIQNAIWKGDDSAILVYDERSLLVITLADKALASGRVLTQFADESTFISARWSMNDTQIVTFDTSMTTRIWDATTYEEVATYTFPEGVTGIVQSDNGNYFASWGADNDVVVWRISDTGRLLSWGRFPHSRTFVIGAAWELNDTVLLTWGADETARLWDVTRADELFKVRHMDWVTGARLNGDGTKLVTWSYQFAYVWDVETGELIRQALHNNLVSGALFNGDET
ncbi:MAG: hypothetical protein MUE54_12555, partial [Anaerolineae bacterium]|nr:hypothetical protein [Anaerolineae bacterium]